MHQLAMSELRHTRRTLRRSAVDGSPGAGNPASQVVAEHTGTIEMHKDTRRYTD